MCGIRKEHFSLRSRFSHLTKKVMRNRRILVFGNLAHIYTEGVNLSGYIYFDTIVSKDSVYNPSRINRVCTALQMAEIVTN